MEQLVNVMQHVLRVDDWAIHLEEDPDILTGFVRFDREMRSAHILYNPETITAHHIRHEMIHVLLHDMSFAASNGRSIEMMEVINMLEERVCNVLAEAFEYL